MPQQGISHVCKPMPIQGHRSITAVRDQQFFTAGGLIPSLSLGLDRVIRTSSSPHPHRSPPTSTVPSRCLRVRCPLLNPTHQSPHRLIWCLESISLASILTWVLAQGKSLNMGFGCSGKGRGAANTGHRGKPCRSDHSRVPGKNNCGGSVMSGVTCGGFDKCWEPGRDGLLTWNIPRGGCASASAPLLVGG